MSTLELAQPLLPKASEVSLPNGLLASPPDPVPFEPNGSSMKGSLVNGSVGVVADCPPPLPPDAPPPLPLNGSEPNRFAPPQDDWRNRWQHTNYTQPIVHVHVCLTTTDMRIPLFRTLWNDDTSIYRTFLAVFMYTLKSEHLTNKDTFFPKDVQIAEVPPYEFCLAL